MRVNRTLSTTSVEILAPVVKLSAGQAVAKLEQNGLNVGNASQSIKKIASANGSKKQKVILARFALSPTESLCCSTLRLFHDRFNHRYDFIHVVRQHLGKP